MYHEKTIDAAKGKWRGILMALGVPESALRDKHGPCPMCGGENRFRFDNKEGKGTSICNQCGARDGMKLAMDFTGRAFSDVASEVDRLVGNLTIDTPKAAISDGDRVALLRRVYAETRPATPGDLVDKYLHFRGCGDTSYPKSLRFHPAMRDGEGGLRPAMVAMVGIYGEAKFVSMHRTFLKPDGMGKAEMESPRKMMPGALPDGACVMLSGFAAHMGIAEGIETARWASKRFEIPVWAALNSTMLSKWVLPQGLESLAVFGDNDAKFGGQAAAYALAHRAARDVDVTVHIPETVGNDWADT